MHYFFFFAFLVVSSSLATFAAADEACVVTAPCVYKLTNGSYIDLSKIPSDMTSGGQSGYFYRFHPCKAFICVGHVYRDALDCKKRDVPKEAIAIIKAGTTPTCAINKDNNLQLAYTNDKRTVLVSLECNTRNETKMGGTADYHNGTYRASLLSEYACFKQGEPLTTVEPPSTNSTKSTTTKATTPSTTHSTTKRTTTVTKQTTSVPVNITTTSTRTTTLGTAQITPLLSLTSLAVLTVTIGVALKF